MLDIHTHILPGIDDGADSLATSLDLCRTLHAQGIREVVATPHWCSPRFEISSTDIMQAWAKLSEAITSAVPGLRLHLGAEHHLSGLQQASSFVASLRPLGSSRSVLIEFPDDHLPDNAWSCLHAVITAGLRPIIAHPERCRGLRGQHRAIQSFLEQGGRLQFDLGNLLGHHGLMMRWRSRSQFARYRAGAIIASDSHNLKVRRPRWDELPPAWRSAVPTSLTELARN